MIYDLLSEQILYLIIGVFLLMKLGLEISGVGLIAFTISQNIAHNLGYEPICRDQFKLYFDQFMDLILHPIGKRVTASHRSLTVNKLVFQFALGAVALIGIVILQVTSMIAVTGAAIASYHLFGQAFNLTSAFNGIAAACVLLTLTIMSYGNHRFQEKILHI